MAQRGTIESAVYLSYQPQLIMNPLHVAEVEPFRLPPIANTNVSQFQLHGDQQAGAVEVSEGLLNISKQVIRLDKSVTSPPSLLASSRQDVSRNIVSNAAPAVPMASFPSKTQRPIVKPRRPSTSKPDIAASLFTFVSVTTSDGKRDWAAETKIRSHAARRVQARKHKEQGKKAQAVQVQPPKTHKTVELPSPPLTPVRGASPTSEQPNLQLDLVQRRDRSTPRQDDCEQSRATRRSHSKVFAHLRCGECDGMAVFQEYDDGFIDVHYVSGMTPNPFGQSLFDPFGQMAEPITHRMHELLSHWVFEHSPKVVPKIYGKKNISKLGVEHELSDAMEDDVACHAISAAAGFQQADLILKNDSSVDSLAVTRSRLRHEEALTHLQQAMQKLNLRFQDSKETLTPSTIINVARLALATAFAGDVKAHKAHHEGFVKLIEMRGGIDTIPREKAHHLSRIESNGAWTDKVRPRIPMYKSEARLLNPSVGSPFPNRELQDFLWEPLFPAAVDLASISYLIDEQLASRSDIPAAREKAEWSEDTFAATQHRLVSFPHPEQQLVKSVMYYRQNCWRCAAFIYFNFVLREAPARGIIQLAVERLIDSLQQSEPWTGWAPHSNILLWVLFMGIIGASTAAEKGLFNLEFRRVLRELQMSTVEEVRGVLRVQVWRDVPLVDHLKTLL